MTAFVIGDWRSLALRGLAAVVFGVLASIWPALTLQALVLLFGAYALVDGILMLTAVVAGAPEARQRRWAPLVEAAVSIITGIVTFVWPGITALALVFVIAAWSLITGVLGIITAIRLRREIRNEWLLALSGVLSVMLAIVLVIAPGAGALALVWVIGLYAVVFGVLLLALAFRIRKIQVPVNGPIPQARRASM